MLAIGEYEGLWDKADPLAKFVPELSASDFAQQTTLLQLVTHTSGLPAIPKNLKSTITNKLNPYANYNEKHLIEALLSEKPKTKNKYRYSNYGFGLLGWLLSKQLGEKYSGALSKQIFKTFGMNNSGVGLGSHLLLPVFNSKNKSTLHWDFLDTTAGAGAVQSTASDMLNYIEAHLGDSNNSLNSALAECRKEHFVFSANKKAGIGYAWMFYKEKNGSTSYWHNGGTYGSSSFSIFNRDKRIGLVILSNHGSGILRQIPLIGTRKMNVDKLALLLTKSLFNESV